MELLRIEGVNLSHCIFDTEDLSTRRGGSLMLLKAIDDIEIKFKKQLQAISTGASAGLFTILNGQQSETIASEIRRWLSTHDLYCHGTFVVDVAQGEFPAASEQVLSANRWQQMQSLSFSGAGLKARKGPACMIDDLRPAYPRGPEDPANSLSVQTRRKHGREQKQDFYKRLVADGSNRQYTQEFESLASKMTHVETPNLEGKMAVFYADGNKFGQVGRNCKTPDDLAEWDKYVKDCRKKLLASIISLASADPRWTAEDDVIRIETLLWGGDEFMFVVPGWCGMKLADLFFEQTVGKMHYPPGNAVPLTHACGLVFCHHKAPISAISKLAKALADKGKDCESTKGKDSLNWVVLESFDHAGSNLDQFLATRYHEKVTDWGQLSLLPGAVHSLAHDLASLKPHLPRSTMVRALRMIVDGAAFGGDDNAKDPMRLLQRSYASVEGALSKPGVDKAAFCRLWEQVHPNGKVLGWDQVAKTETKPATDDLPAWVKLLELWDYCQPDKCPANVNAVLTHNEVTS